MTLTQLRYAITVANANSMSEAARTLFISQPSLSAAVKELEEETGIELFRRTNRGISLTPDGEEFIGYARQVVEQYELMENKYISKQQTKKKFSVSMQHYAFAVNAFV
ncbi:MAG: LysR family transcriptional regulator, partial [Clostridiales bacterium]|nr:LysR family transcriptional regulator [Clostridiales bacterium]